jgi:fumarate reductase subunit C
MIKFINEHLIHPNIIHQNLQKYQRNQWISFVPFAVIMRLDLIMMLFRVLHAKLFFVEMLSKIRLVSSSVGFFSYYDFF